MKKYTFLLVSVFSLLILPDHSRGISEECKWTLINSEPQLSFHLPDPQTHRGFQILGHQAAELMNRGYSLVLHDGKGERAWTMIFPWALRQLPPNTQVTEARHSVYNLAELFQRWSEIVTPLTAENQVIAVSLFDSPGSVLIFTRRSREVYLGIADGKEH